MICTEAPLQKEVFPPPASFADQANVWSESLFEQAKAGIEPFWEDQAKDLTWFKKWDKVLTWQSPFSEWFSGGKLNVSYNCLDRHVLNGDGNRICLIWEGESGEVKKLTYQELLDEVCRVANGLKKLGVKEGDRVAIYMPMIPETIAAMLACARIGAPHLVIFGGIGASGVRDRILDGQAKVLITVDEGVRRNKALQFKEIVDEALQEAPCVESVVVLRYRGKERTLKKGRDIWYDELLEDCSTDCPPAILDAEHILFILYTSGSTGKPKGIYHTTAGYLLGVQQTFKWVFDIKKEDIYWCTADVGWITGHSFVVYGPMANGATQIIYEGAFDFPSKGRCWEIVQRHKATIFYTAPTTIRTFIKWGAEWVQKSDISTLRLLGSIGEPINPDVWLWYRKHIGHDQCPIVDTWFQTETGALVLSPLPGLTPLKPGSVTKALPGFDVAVLDETGNPADVGFLAICKPYPSMMRGIYNDPERYKSIYWSKWKGSYYFSGDGARRDGDGYFWVTGRLDDVLKVSGHRIGTAEVESALVEHPFVAEAAVIGVPDPLKGEAIFAFAILKETDSRSIRGLEEILKKSVSAKIGSYACPTRILIVPDLPKTRSGKIMRRLLKDLVENRPLGDLTTLESVAVMEKLQMIADEQLRSGERICQC